MKKLVKVYFDWYESYSTSAGPSYELHTVIGTLVLEKKVHLFADERGFYDGNEEPPVFTKDLSAAKKRIENQLLTALG